MDKIAAISKRCRIFCTLLYGVVLIGAVGMWVFMTPELALMFGADVKQVIITPATKILGVAITVIPLSVILYGLYLLINLFKNYEKGQVFTLLNAIILRRIGLLSYIWVICEVIYSTLLVLVLTFQNPPGEKILQITLLPSSIIPLVFGSIIISISWVLVEAQKVAEDHALIP
ncbi:DUF2975 domain-containing protein [Spartinivicinus poritis]|uniref:DUF2975 domain-containing protein n=1 Tax=Spartinivicinus poritis TaxID=2994640 RepID=A0ABT5UCB7_9GAMM|nr:DUF2975 domain-containing protein [Spartinivicinus sp. A2-2]MDE1464021.1 DUF2975 domain-containing protein [Spartinivicinus sp. A2-2]